MSKKDIIKHKKGEVIKEAQIDGIDNNQDTLKKVLFTILLFIIFILCFIKIFK